MSNQYDPYTGRTAPQQYYYAVPPEGFEPPEGYPQKSRLAAGIFAMIFGYLGIHNFYLGFNQRATTQLLVSLLGAVLTCGISTIAMAIWGIIEGVRILEHKSNIDANGIRLKD